MSPVAHLGSTFIKIFSAGMVKTSGVIGHLKDRDSPYGRKKLSVTALLSSSTCRTHAIQHFYSYMHATKPLIP